MAKSLGDRGNDAEFAAAAIGKGSSLHKPRFSEALRTGLIFGVIEAITPVIGWAIGQAASYGWQDLLEMLALITVNVGIFNLLPFPALDGGKVVFLLIEGVTGHAVPEKIQSGLIMAAFALLFGLMIFATYNDILRLITGAM